MQHIDTFKESVISLEQAAAHVSKLSGKKRNRSVILRWINRGVHGTRLPGIRIAGEVFTSKEALNEFLNRSRERAHRRHARQTIAGMQARQAQLDQEAEALGI